LMSAIGFVLWNHQPVEVLVDRAPGALFVVDDDGMVRNTYMVKLVDRDADPGTRVYVIGVEGLPEGSVVRAKPVQLQTEQADTQPVIVRIPVDDAKRTVPLTFVIRGEDLEIRKETTFKGPTQEP